MVTSDMELLISRTDKKGLEKMDSIEPLAMSALEWYSVWNEELFLFNCFERYRISQRNPFSLAARDLFIL